MAKRNSLLGSASALILFNAMGMGMVAQASAQTTASSSGRNSEPEAFEEILVTASRRSVNSQDLAMSIRALSEKQLMDIGADDFADYVNLVPGLNFSERGPGESRIIIRGVASNTGVSTVGLYLDELPVQDQGRNPDSKLFDVERVEVLRGPQGTLYGEGSMGGAIRIITNKADPSSYRAAADVSLFEVKGGGTSYALNGMVNVPLVEDKFAVRVVGLYRDEAGYVDNVALGQKDVNTNETTGVRVTGRLLASDRLTITALYNYNKVKTGGLFGIDPDLSDLQQARVLEEPLRDSYNQYGLTIEYAFPWANLTSATSYFTRDVGFIRNAGGSAHVDVGADDKILVQEVRLVSSTDGPFQWLAGLFYKEAKYRQTAFFVDPTFPEFLGGPVLVEDSSSSKAEQMAAFGEISYRLADKLEATAGLRLFREKLSGRTVASGIPLIFPNGPEDISNKGDNNVVTPKFALSYKASDDALLYGIIAKGYRQGGFNPPEELTGGAPETFEPDSTWNYELGAKTSWFNNRLVVNAAVYYIDWKNLQVIPAFNPFQLRYVDNVGKAHSAGGELEIVARPFRGFELSASGNLTYAEIDVDTELGPKGSWLPRVPRHSFAVSASYEWALTPNLKGVIRGNVQEVGKSYSQLDNAPVSRAPAYQTGDLRMGVEADNWSAHLFVKNIWDERGIAEADLLASGLYTIIQPRVIGLNLRARL